MKSILKKTTAVSNNVPPYYSCTGSGKKCICCFSDLPSFKTPRKKLEESLCVDFLGSTLLFCLMSYPRVFRCHEWHCSSGSIHFMLVICFILFLFARGCCKPLQPSGIHFLWNSRSLSWIRKWHQNFHWQRIPFKQDFTTGYKTSDIRVLRCWGGG